MKRHTHIRPELREWILTTTRAGHSTDEVLRLMKETGYDPRESRVIVATVLKLPLAALTSAAKPKGCAPASRSLRWWMSTASGPGSALSVDAPVLRVLDHLLDDQECDALIELARPRLDRALTVDTEGRQQVDHRRTSEGMFFRLGETPLIERIEAAWRRCSGCPRPMARGCRFCITAPARTTSPTSTGSIRTNRIRGDHRARRPAGGQCGDVSQYPRSRRRHRISGSGSR